MTVNRIARYTGTTWESLNGGMNNSVFYLKPDDEDGNGPIPPALWVGGSFTTADSKGSSEIAKWSVVPTPPSITQQPVSQSACEGGTISLAVTATGDPPLSYQWRKGMSDVVDSGRISGSMTAALVINPALPADSAADYYCNVTSACGSAATANVTVTVFPSGSGNGNGDAPPANGLDIQGMVSALIPPGSPPSAVKCPYDMDIDGDVDLVDVPLFVNLLLQP